MVNPEPCLMTTETSETEPPNKVAKQMREQRVIERGLLQELSMYYARSEGFWTRPQLLSTRKHRIFEHIDDISLTPPH